MFYGVNGVVTLFCMTFRSCDYEIDGGAMIHRLVWSKSHMTYDLFVSTQTILNRLYFTYFHLF